MRSLTLLLLLFLVACASTKTFTVANNKTVAHRGAWKTSGHPQNSIAALKQAISLSCAGSEFDVRMTKDDVLIINHDATYAGDTIELTTYQTLARQTLLNGEKLPTLAEYLRAGIKHNKQTQLVIEVKPSIVDKSQAVRAAEKTVALVKAMNMSKRVAYISFDYFVLKRIHALDPTAITQYLEGDKTPTELQSDGISGADYHISVYRKNPEWITQLKQNRMILNAWTVNTTEEMDWLLQQGFDFITTDQPELLLERVKHLSEKSF